MIVEFDKSFLKSVTKIRDKITSLKVESAIIELENAKSLKDIRNLKKLIGYRNYYRIKLGEFRLGFELINSRTIRLIIFANRKDIYKTFPGKS